MTLTTTTSDERLMAGFAYWGNFLLWIIPALVLFFIKKDESAYIKRHALQSVFLGLGFTALSIMLGILNAIIWTIPFVKIFGIFTMLACLLAWIGYWVYSGILGYQAYQGQDPRIPYISDFAGKSL